MKEKIKKFIEKNKRGLILLIATIIVVAILENIFSNEIMEYDAIAYLIIVAYSRANWLTPIVKIITQFGSAIVLISICILSIALIKNKKIGLLMSGNLICITALNVLLKNIIQRPRPIGYRLISESGYSFPSGHSMVSTAFYGLIIYFILKNVKNKYLKWGTITILSILILLICLSRIYLGVHYASDTIGGFFISIAYLTIYTNLASKLTQQK